MKALLLAAGTGSRLHPLTIGKPKTMLEIMGFPIIHYLISGLIKHGIKDICILTGHQQHILIKYILETFPGRSFNFIYNPYFQEMNNIYSFFLSAPYFYGSDILAINSDVFCEEELLREAVFSPLDSMIIDSEKEFSSEATKVQLDKQGRIIKISKDILHKESQGEYIGILKLSASNCCLLHEKVSEMLYQGQTGLWYVYALNELLPGLSIYPVFTRGRIWEEIDTLEDYQHALKLAEYMSSRVKM